MWVRRYDHDNDGRLLFSDFSDAFTPSNVAASQDLNRRIGSGAPAHLCLDVETREHFFAVFRSALIAEEGAELTRQRVTRRPTFNVHDAYAAVDLDRNGFVTL